MFFGARPLLRSAARSFHDLQRAALAIALFAGSATAGCGEDRHEVDTPNTAPRGLAPRPAPEANAAPSAIAPQRSQPKLDPYLNMAPTAGPAAAPVAAEEEKPRDYSAELQSAMRGAESCVKPRPASASLPAEVIVSLEGLVLESGTIVTGAARGSVLVPEELECVKKRLESTRLPGGVKDAPRRVSAPLKLTFRQAGSAPNAPNAPAAAAAPARPAAVAAPDLPPPSDQTPPEDTSATRDEPEAIAPVEPSAPPSY